MAWTVPMTAVNGSVLTAAQWNQSIRDNLMETAAAKATTSGQLIVSSGAGKIVARSPGYQLISALETLTGVPAGSSSGYSDLTTIGPTVTLSTGTTAFIFVSALMATSQPTAYVLTGYDVSGASSIAASSTAGLNFRAAAANQQFRGGVVDWVNTLTPGLNTFTMRYAVTAHATNATNGTFGQRVLFVLPFN